MMRSRYCCRVPKLYARLDLDVLFLILVLDRTSLVSPAGEPSDYAGYWVVSWETISLTRRLGRAVRRTTQPKQPGQRLSKDSAVNENGMRIRARYLGGRGFVFDLPSPPVGG